MRVNKRDGRKGVYSGTLTEIKGEVPGVREDPNDATE